MPKFDTSHYIDCQSRINRFWSEHPEGKIVTELVSDPNNYNHVVFKASVYKVQPDVLCIPDATGYAAEERADDPRGGANFTNWHENGETSAIGRALANMGYATSLKDRPSREEMDKANRGYEQRASTPGNGEGWGDPDMERAARDTEPLTDNQRRMIWGVGRHELKLSDDTLHNIVYHWTRKASINDLTKWQARLLIDRLKNSQTGDVELPNADQLAAAAMARDALAAQD